MNSYRVSFYKDLLNSSGHSFKCLQRQIDVQSDGPSQALVLAQQLTHSESLEVDCVEVRSPGRQSSFGANRKRSNALCANTHGAVAVIIS